MPNEQYVTITHYKEREFYYLSHAIQTEDGFIPKEIEQFHESEKDEFIKQIRLLKDKYTNVQITSISLSVNQKITEEEDKNRLSIKISNRNFIIQDKLDIGNIPTTLYFSPFAILYEEYKKRLDNKLTLLVGYFDRKLFMMFATRDKIHQSWVIGTRGLTEKQIAFRVYKSIKAYYKMSFKFADHIEMLINDDSPKLLKVLREELPLNIVTTQNTIHNLLHNMARDKERVALSYIRSTTLSINSHINNNVKNKSYHIAENSNNSDIPLKIDSLDDLKINNYTNPSVDLSLFDKLKLFVKGSHSSGSTPRKTLLTFLPIISLLGVGGYFITLENQKISTSIKILQSQKYSQIDQALLASNSKKIFLAMGKNGELKSASISNSLIKINGIVWGIEPLQDNLMKLYPNGSWSIEPATNFTTEFKFKSKV